MNKNSLFEGSAWVTEHEAAIKTIARFSGLDFAAAAICLYERAHKEELVQQQNLQQAA